MATISKINPVSISNPLEGQMSFSVANRFTKWCESLEGVRFLLTSGIILVQGCVVIPALLLLIQYVNIGISDFSAGIAAVTTLGTLVACISESPMKAVVITFAVNLLVNFALIAVHITAFIN